MNIDCFKKTSKKNNKKRSMVKEAININNNSNAYYFRNNKTGEQKKRGQWTKNEMKLFHLRLKEMGANYHWGDFSITIPGRVGYACSDFYRFLYLFIHLFFFFFFFLQNSFYKN